MDFSGISGIRQVTDSGMMAPANPNQRLGQEDFLRLMIAQLRNQDPFEPMENGQFLGQMAQFSTLSGIQDLQRSFDATTEVLSSSQSLQAASLVDRSALVESSRLGFDGESAVRGSVDLPPGALAVEVTIRDASGAQVRRIPAQIGADGRAEFVWDGFNSSGRLMGAGEYQISAEVRVGSQTQSARTLVWANIDSVSLSSARGGGVTLNLAGLGPIALQQAREIS